MRGVVAYVSLFLTAAEDAMVAHRYMKEVGVPGAEIVRHLGVTTSSITRAITRVEE